MYFQNTFTIIESKSWSIYDLSSDNRKTTFPRLSFNFGFPLCLFLGMVIHLDFFLIFTFICFDPTVTLFRPRYLCMCTFLLTPFFIFLIPSLHRTLRRRGSSHSLEQTQKTYLIPL